MMQLLKDSPQFVDIPHIVLRLPISSAKANRPIQALADRTAWLKQQLDNLQLGGNGAGIHFIGTLDNQEALDSIDTSTLPDGSAYFVADTIAVWNLSEWVVSESLRGPQGEGIGELDDLDLLTVYQTAKEG